MIDLAAGFGIALVLEGLLWALAPDLARRLIRDLGELPARQLAIFAWIMVAAGLALVWLTRG